MTLELKAIGHAIRKSRGDRSIEAIAAAVGVSSATWYRYESGDIDIPISKLIRVCKGLGVSLIKLLHIAADFGVTTSSS